MTAVAARAAPPRMRRVNIAYEADDRIVIPKIPRGCTRPASQAAWVRHLSNVLDAAPLRDDRRRTLRCVAMTLLSWADWETHTTRPTWERLMKAVAEQLPRGASRRSIARSIATLIEWRVIARVAHGRKAEFAPGEDATNEAAVYVLIVPTRLRAVDRIGTPPRGSESEALPVHARARQPHVEPLRGTPALGAPAAPTPDRALSRQHPLGACQATKQRTDQPSLVALELIERLPVLRQISWQDVRSCLRHLVLAGWTAHDIAHALDWKPDGERWPHDGADGVSPYGVRGWIRYRLAPWHTDDGIPLKSLTQRSEADRAYRRAQHRALMERQEAAARDRVAPTGEWRQMRAHLKQHRSDSPGMSCSHCVEAGWWNE